MLSSCHYLKYFIAPFLRFRLKKTYLPDIVYSGTLTFLLSYKTPWLLGQIQLKTNFYASFCKNVFSSKRPIEILSYFLLGG